MNRIFNSLLFWLVFSSVLAYAWPVQQLQFDPFTPPDSIKKPLIWALVACAMFFLGTLVRREELGPLLKHPWWVVLGVLTQILVMPATAWGVTQLIPLDQDIANGVILVGCVPGAMASNVLTSTARGSVAYSVCLTSVATLLSPLTVPLMLWVVASAATEKSLLESSILLSVLVVLPTVLGFHACQKWNRFQNWSVVWGPRIAPFTLLWIIVLVVAGDRENLMHVGLVIVLALLLINVVGYLAGWSVGGIAKLPEACRRALTLEVGMQNAGIGTALAVTLYGEDSLATIPTAAYTFGCMLTGTILAVGWQRGGKYVEGIAEPGRAADGVSDE
ncbi:MAG: bile acid:sodium symporter family protein [Rubripirellula sp.]